MQPQQDWFRYLSPFIGVIIGFFLNRFWDFYNEKKNIKEIGLRHIVEISDIQPSLVERILYLKKIKSQIQKNNTYFGERRVGLDLDYIKNVDKTTIIKYLSNGKSDQYIATYRKVSTVTKFFKDLIDIQDFAKDYEEKFESRFNVVYDEYVAADKLFSKEVRALTAIELTEESQVTGDILTKTIRFYLNRYINRASSIHFSYINEFFQDFSYTIPKPVPRELVSVNEMAHSAKYSVVKLIKLEQRYLSDITYEIDQLEKLEVEINNIVLIFKPRESRLKEIYNKYIQKNP